MLLLTSADFFFKMYFFKTLSEYVSNNLDPDQDGHSVSPDPNCLQMSSTDNKIHQQLGKSKVTNLVQMFKQPFYCCIIGLLTSGKPTSIDTIVYVAKI